MHPYQKHRLHIKVNTKKVPPSKIKNGFELVFRFEIQYQYRYCTTTTDGGPMAERNWQSTNVSKRVGAPLRQGPLGDRLTLWMRRRSAFTSLRFFHNPCDCRLRGASLPPLVIPPSFRATLVKLSTPCHFRDWTA